MVLRTNFRALCSAHTGLLFSRMYLPGCTRWVRAEDSSFGHHLLRVYHYSAAQLGLLSLCGPSRKKKELSYIFCLDSLGFSCDYSFKETGQSLVSFLFPPRKMIYPNPFVPTDVLSIHSILWQEASQLSQLLGDHFKCVPCQTLLHRVEGCPQQGDWQQALPRICDRDM